MYSKPSPFNCLNYVGHEYLYKLSEGALQGIIHFNLYWRL